MSGSRSNDGEWMLRIEYSDKRSENRLYKSYGRVKNAAERAILKYGAHPRIFKEWHEDSFEQLNLFEQEPEF